MSFNDEEKKVLLIYLSLALVNLEKKKDLTADDIKDIESIKSILRKILGE